MAQTAGTKLLPEQAKDKICQYIEDNGLKKGDKLPNEFRLAELCQVSRSTVREAVKLLVYEGAVEILRGSGTYITGHKKEPKPESTPEEEDPMKLKERAQENEARTALEYWDVRLLLEPEIAALAAANADYRDCQKLLEAHHEVVSFVNRGENHAQADIRFHSQIAACTHNTVLCSLMDLVVSGIPIFIKITENRVVEETVKHHGQITDSIVNGDAVGARCAMIAHLNSNRKRLISALGSPNPRAGAKQSAHTGIDR